MSDDCISIELMVGGWVIELNGVKRVATDNEVAKGIVNRLMDSAWKMIEFDEHGEAVVVAEQVAEEMQSEARRRRNRGRK